MNDIEIIDKFVDDREFRNYVISYLKDEDYNLVSVDDPRISDRNKDNDNDFVMVKNDVLYTVQTFLNKEINQDELNETIKDIDKEKVCNAIIVTNRVVDSNILKEGEKSNITIIDRNKLIK